MVHEVCVVNYKLILRSWMKNVTVTMEDSVAEWARMEAARRNTSVSRLVGQMLAEKMRHEWRNRQRVYRSDGAPYPQRDGNRRPG